MPLLFIVAYTYEGKHKDLLIWLTIGIFIRFRRTAGINRHKPSVKVKENGGSLAADTRKPRAVSLEQIKPPLSKLADSLGDRLISVGYVREPHGKVLRIVIDKTVADARISADTSFGASFGVSSGISLDDCERFHKLAVELVEQVEYDYLEVSSRGADRRLETDGDIVECVGRNVDVRLYKPSPAYPALGKKFEGAIESVRMKESIKEGVKEGIKEGQGEVETITFSTGAGMAEIRKSEIAVIKLAVAMPEEAAGATNDY